MRNLRNIRHEVWQAPSAISALCWDVASDSVLVAQGPSADDAGVRLARVAESSSRSHSHSLLGKTVAEWEAPGPSPELAVDRIVLLHHFADTATSCVVFAGGDLVLVREHHDATAHIEIVGSIDAGVTAARWAPDEELLLMVTAASTAIFMSRSFDAVAEVTLTVDDLRLSKQVSVGWGKKETQFQGKGAKAKPLRDPTIPEKVDEGVLSGLDDGRTTVSWRGDGAYVAVNSIEAGARRVIRVYSREGQLDSVSEPVDGLEGALSWQPAGNLMAGVQRQADGGVDVVFFERNGLRHGQFTLRVPDDEAGNAARHISLEWNQSSTVLAVTLADRIQLWTMGNYHWYLKQEIFCGGGGWPVMTWHSEKTLTFASATPAALRIDEYVFTVARGSAVPPYDFGAVAVIDGLTVKMTPFRTATIPPPMAMFELELEASALDVAFSPDSSLVAVLHQAGVNLYACELKDSRVVGPTLLHTAPFDKGKWSILQVAFSGPKEVQLLQSGETSKLLACDFEKQHPEYKECCSSSEAAMIRTIISPVAPGTLGALAQDRSGRFFSYVKGVREQKTFGFAVHLPWAEVWERNGRSFAFGLSRNGHLYANSRQLAKNCTSFLVTKDHVVFTTTNHVVKFVHLSDADELEVIPDEAEKDERCRNMERGAKLVTAVPTNMNLVLQMPRGNLECVYPRAMVLSGIRQLVEARDYARAFAFCRTQRVDMNLLCDHKPHQFLADMGLFLDQLEHVSNIDLFLTSIREEDVTVALYKDTKPRQAVSRHADSPFSARKPKVNSICDAVLDTLLARKNANLQNIITAHFCKIPPALEDGLEVIAGLLHEDETLAERAVEHACFLVDVNRIYDQALGLYNLELAMLVAQQSQRDPREYVPLVQKLHQMEPTRRRFAIDDHLERRDKALRHLRDLGDFEEVKKYTTRHHLYQTALGLYRYDEQHQGVLTALYAAHLESKSKFGEAGLAYESLGNFGRATACYQQAGTAYWRECLFCAQRQQQQQQQEQQQQQQQEQQQQQQQEQDAPAPPPLSAEAFADLASTLAEALHEAKDHAAAAAVHLDYLGSPEAAIRSLCRGYLFADALRLAAMQRRPDLLAAAVDPGLVDAFSATTDFLADCNAQLRAQVPRIAELRRRATEDPLGFYGGEGEGEGEGARQADLPDNVSVTASSRAMAMSASLLTRYTGHASGSSRTAGSGESRATAKNRRREEKKRARGRKGTVYEEAYLVQSLRRLVARVGAAVPEAERLVLGLARRGMAERARAVEALVADTLDACRRAVAEVWPGAEDGTETGTGGGEGEGEGEGAGAGAGDGDRETMGKPPVVARLERLSLLGV